ncbi:TetR/AcrR family transcriptional regulator [Nocardia sp. NPDC049707]|uniref:TetR/AcrR family transcriptional regulator n=1 Tax=Nocardia sp. NPDC049707 TaxID=3154735 RepID=UPI0034380A2A
MAGRRAETTRESRMLLLNAATALFTEKGYQQTTFADVAERSGISRGSIPWHFGSKEGLLGAVLDHAAEILLEESAGEGSTVATLVDGARRAAPLRTSLLFVTLYVEAVKPDSPIHDRYAALHDRLRESVKQWIERSSVRLPEAITSDDLAVLLVGAGIGIHLQWAMAPEKINMNRAFDKLGELFDTMLRSATAAG